MLAISLVPYYQSVRGKLRAVPSYLISPARHALEAVPGNILAEFACKRLVLTLL